MGHINTNSFVPQGADTQHEGRASPYDPDRFGGKPSVQGEAAGPDNETQGTCKHLPPTQI